MVHRPSALKPVARGSSLTVGFLMILIAVGTLQIAWTAWFLSDPLPNAGNAGGRGITRSLLVIRAVPEVIVPDLKFKDSYLGMALKELTRVKFLPQRLPIVLAAGLIAVAAVSTGSLGLRLFGRTGLRARWPSALTTGTEARSTEEWVALSFLLGTTAIGALTLIAGRLGLLTPWGVRIGLGLPIVAEVALMFLVRRSVEPSAPSRSWWPSIGFGLVAGPFLLIMALGAMLPTIDFDAIEYHLQGPKEYYQAGRIAFLPHNVYTSMPFSIEMLHLLGMEVVDDWWLGALVGQLVVAMFAPAAAVLIGSTATRLGSPRAGWVAAIVYLTTPWIYRLAVLPYVEGPLCAYHAALVWAVARFESGEKTDRLSIGILVGLLASGAMAIKYPALISAVIPFGAWAIFRAWRDRDWRVVAGFGIGVGLVMAPWLVKNVVDTANPVYPLGYKVFGGRAWDVAMDAKWSAAHGPRPIEVKSFFLSIVDIAGRSDWQSPLYASLAPLAYLRIGSRRSSQWLAIFAAYLFLTWWLFTHRLDRFWLPILPSLAVLAGLGADWVRSRIWTGMLMTLMGLAIVGNAVYCSTALAGLNQWTGNLEAMRSDVPMMLNPPMGRLDAELPPGSKVLLVGQAAVFHLNHPVVYNTVFNKETIETISKGRKPEEVARTLAEMGVTHVYVDWFDVERYRSPGNYGFTDYVTDDVFRRLVDAKVLSIPKPIGLKQDLYQVIGR